MHLQSNKLLYDFVRDFQKEFPFVTLGGSLALWLYGYEERNSSDIDFVVANKWEASGLIKLNKMVPMGSGGNKYQHVKNEIFQSGQVLYKDMEICFFVRPDIIIHPERLEDIQVQSVDQILVAKQFYASRKSSKHCEDLDHFKIEYKIPEDCYVKIELGDLSKLNTEFQIPQEVLKT
jgi:hypothetical protein